MPRPSILHVFVGLVAVGVVALAATHLLGGSAPLPDPPSLVSPSAEFVNAEASIDYYREGLRRDPDDLRSRVALAQVLLQQATTTGRESDYIPEAREHLERALRQAPDDVHGRLLQASLFNTLHRFEDARDLARELLAEYPDLAFAHGVLVDGLVELGEYEEAVVASDRMLVVKPGLAAYSRASYLRELHGDQEGAISAMRLAADAGAPGRADRAWALHALGTLYLGSAKPDTAAMVFETILDERPDNPDAIAGLGHVALIQGDVDRAIERLRDAYRIAPKEAFLELLAEAYAVLGNRRAAETSLDAVGRALDDAREMGEIVDMEEADFLLDRGRDRRRALRMAAAQLRRRPGHLHANETYAWALHSNGRSAEAIRFIEHAMRLNTGDAMVHHRASQIYRAAGRPAAAARHARLALDNHLHVESPTAAAESRSVLASLVAHPAPTDVAVLR